MLKARWKQILFGAIFQYVHAMSTQLAHRMHQPQEEPLSDIGFKYLPVRLVPPQRLVTPLQRSERRRRSCPVRLAPLS